MKADQQRERVSQLTCVLNFRRKARDLGSRPTDYAHNLQQSLSTQRGRAVSLEEVAEYLNGLVVDAESQLAAAVAAAESQKQPKPKVMKESNNNTLAVASPTPKPAIAPRPIQMDPDQMAMGLMQYGSFAGWWLEELRRLAVPDGFTYLVVIVHREALTHLPARPSKMPFFMTSAVGSTPHEALCNVCRLVLS